MKVFFLTVLIAAAVFIGCPETPEVNSGVDSSGRLERSSADDNILEL